MGTVAIIGSNKRSVTVRLPEWIVERIETEAQNSETTVTALIEYNLRQAYGDPCTKCGVAIVPEEFRKVPPKDASTIKRRVGQGWSR